MDSVSDSESVCDADLVIVADSEPVSVSVTEKVPFVLVRDKVNDSVSVRLALEGVATSDAVRVVERESEDDSVSDSDSVGVKLMDDESEEDSDNVTDVPVFV